MVMWGRFAYCYTQINAFLPQWDRSWSTCLSICPSVHPWLYHVSLTWVYDVSLILYFLRLSCHLRISPSPCGPQNRWLVGTKLYEVVPAVKILHMHMCMHGRADGILHIFALGLWLVPIKSDTTHSADPPSINKNQRPPSTSPQPATCCNQHRFGWHIGCSSAHRPRSSSPSQSINRGSR